MSNPLSRTELDRRLTGLTLAKERNGGDWVTLADVRSVIGSESDKSARRSYKYLRRVYGGKMPRLISAYELECRRYAEELCEIARWRGYIIPADIRDVTGTEHIERTLSRLEKYGLALPRLVNERRNEMNSLPRTSRSEAREEIPQGIEVRCDPKYPNLPPPSLEAMSRRVEGGKTFYMLK